MPGAVETEFVSKDKRCFGSPADVAAAALLEAAGVDSDHDIRPFFVLG